MNFVHQIVRPGAPSPLSASMAWVMEPEVERPTKGFLSFPTQRCFMEDRVDARCVIDDHIAAKARVDFDVRAVDGTKLVFISTDAAAVKQVVNDYKFSAQRPLTQSNNILEASENDSSAAILYDLYIKPETDDLMTRIVTNIFIPVVAGKDSVDIYFTVTITGTASLQTDKSFLLRACRWWADPPKNMGHQKNHADKIEPLVDGEAYFNRAATLINSASKYIYIFSWSFWMDTFLTGEPGGGGTKLSDALRDAAKRGVKIYILVDSANGGWAVPLLQKHLNDPNIYVTLATHHRKAVGVTVGTYHEKYICVDGKTAVVGGMDFMPDRYNSPKHDYKSDNKKFVAQVKAIGFNFTGFDEKFMLWHDTAVLVEGPVVTNVESAFASRWNEWRVVDPVQQNLLPLPVINQAQGDHNAQVVKTDHIVVHTSLAPPPIPHPGTFDAYKQAITEARHCIYIEDQYFRHAALGDLLVKALEARTNLALIVVIPFFTEEAKKEKHFAWEDFVTWLFKKANVQVQDVRDRMAAHGDYLQAQLIERVRKVSNADKRVGIYALAGAVTSGTQAEQIYPHSKTMIVDDTWAIVGSANTNGRGFVSDGEMSIVFHRRPEVTALRKALWKEHLGVEVDTRDIRKFFTEWQRLSLSEQNSASGCAVSDVRKVHAVKFKTPRKGQQYNGPGFLVYKCR